MTREEIAVGLAKDPAFKKLTPDRQQAVFEEAVTRAGDNEASAEHSPMERLGDLRLVPTAPRLREYPRFLANAASAATGGIVNPEDLLPFNQNSYTNRVLAEQAQRTGQSFEPRGINYAQIEGLPSNIANAVGIGAGILAGVPGRAFSAAEQAVARVPVFARNAFTRAGGNALSGAVGGVASDFGDPDTYMRNALLGAGANIALPPAIAAIAKRIGGARQTPYERVVATLPEDVGKLSTREQQAYYQAQQRQLQIQTTIQRTTMQQRHRLATEQLKTEWGKLNQSLQVAGRDEVLRVRPLIKQALGQKSQQYRTLADEAFQFNENVPVDMYDLNDFIQHRWGKDHETLNAITSHLGLGNLPQRPAGEQLHQFVVGKYPATAARRTVLRDLHERAKAVIADIPRGSGYSREELFADRTYGTLIDYLKQKGVDLGETNRMWATWSRIRDQAVQEVKPFNIAKTETGQFANRLVRIAQGRDPNNEIYIRSLEEAIGQPLGKDLRPLVQQLDAVKKAQMAQQLQLESQRADVTLQAVRQKAGLEERQFNTMTRAVKREKLLSVLKYALGGSAVIEGARRIIGAVQN